MTPDLLRDPPLASRTGPTDAADAAGAESATEVLAVARALEATGRRVIHLEVGEPDAPTPPHIVEAGVRALRAGLTRYAPTAGIPELRAAAAASLVARGVPAEPARVVVAPGAKAMLFATFLAAVRPGDEVLVPDPGYGPYAAVAELAGGRAVRYPLDARCDFTIDPTTVAARVTSRTRVLVLNAPSNPTGGVIAPAALAGLAELALRHDLLVVSDEIYARHVYPDGGRAGAACLTGAGLTGTGLTGTGLTGDGLTAAGRADAPPAHPSVAALPGMADRTVVVDGLSKAYAMTGWRLGYGALPARLVAPVTALLAHGATCTATFVQHAGVAALTGPQDEVAAQVAALRRRRDRLVAALNAIEGVRCGVPRGALYAFPHVAGALAARGETANAFARRLLQDYGVACVAGPAFGPGGAGHLRLTFAASDEDLAAAAVALRACASGGRA